MPLVALLALTLGLASVLAYEAHDAARSHRATAERALHDDASVAGWELLAGAVAQLERPIDNALAPATAIRAGSAFEALLPPSAIAPSVADVMPCPPSREAPRFAFRLDFRDGSYAIAPVAPFVSSAEPPRFAAWVRDAVSRAARSAYRPDWRFAAILAPAPFAGQGVVYAVKYAEHGAPIAAFGFTTCSRAFGPDLLRDVVARRPLLPGALTGPVKAESLLAVVVTAPGGDTLYRSGDTHALLASATTTHPMLAGLEAHVGVRPAAMTQLAIGAPFTSRLPLLLGLLALTAALVVMAVVQLRHEQQLARLRSDFVSSVSHELRTPLSQILLFAETLRLDRVRSDAERREAAEVIVQEARRLGQLVDNVLHVARSERRLTSVALEPVALAPWVRRVVAAWQPLANGRCAVRLALDNAATAYVDPDALRHMLCNVLENAEKYGPRGQTITVGLASSGSHVRLWVDDEGPGIPDGAQERIWEPFVRLPRDVHSSTVGSGIGLFVVKELATLQGAAVSADRSPSGGARFLFVFDNGRASGSATDASKHRAEVAP